MIIEDIITQHAEDAAFLCSCGMPLSPSPIMGCPECGGDFVRHTTIPTTMSTTDPNLVADHAQNNP